MYKQVSDQQAVEATWESLLDARDSSQLAHIISFSRWSMENDVVGVIASSSIFVLNADVICCGIDAHLSFSQWKEIYCLGKKKKSRGLEGFQTTYVSFNE